MCFFISSFHLVMAFLWHNYIPVFFLLKKRKNLSPGQPFFKLSTSGSFVLLLKVQNRTLNSLLFVCTLKKFFISLLIRSQRSHWLECLWCWFQWTNVASHVMLSQITDYISWATIGFCPHARLPAVFGYANNLTDLFLVSHSAEALSHSLPLDVYIRRKNNHQVGGQGRKYTSNLNFVSSHLSQPGHWHGGCCMPSKCHLRQWYACLQCVQERICILQSTNQ